MRDITFCFRIEAAAGMARDGNGDPDECYAQIKLEGCKTPPEDMEAAHKHMAEGLAKQLSIDPELVVPISEAEYEDNTL